MDGQTEKNNQDRQKDGHTDWQKNKIDKVMTDIQTNKYKHKNGQTNKLKDRHKNGPIKLYTQFNLNAH